MADRRISGVFDGYDAILSDFDGTVIDSERIHANIGVRLLNKYGVPDMTFEERYGMMGFGEYRIHEELTRAGRRPTITAEQFKQAQAKEFITEMSRVTDPNSILRRGYREFAERAEAAGKPIYIVSNTARESVVAGMRASQLTDIIPESRIFAFDYFHALGIARKPDPAPFLHVAKLATAELERKGVKTTGRFLALEDSQTGFNAAHAAGLDTILIFYDGVGQSPDNRATRNVPDSRCLRFAFDQCRSDCALVKLQAGIKGIGSTVAPHIQQTVITHGPNVAPA